MSFEPACLIGNQSICSGVRFIEAIAGKLFHQIKDIRGEVFRKSFPYSALHKQISLFRHFSGILFTHSAAEQIGSPQSVPAHLLCDLHYLLLIQNNAISRLKRCFKALVLVLWMRITNLCPPFFPVNKVIYHSRLKRTGPK